MMGDVFERNVGDALAFKAASRVIERACLWVRPARRPGFQSFWHRSRVYRVKRSALANFRVRAARRGLE
jgi:hypothetical protein